MRMPSGAAAAGPPPAPPPASRPPDVTPPPRRNGRPPHDLSKLPAAIRESLAKLAGDPSEEDAKTHAPPPASDTTTRER
jgi:hypothetical protein